MTTTKSCDVRQEEEMEEETCAVRILDRHMISDGEYYEEGQIACQTLGSATLVEAVGKARRAACNGSPRSWCTRTCAYSNRRDHQSEYNTDLQNIRSGSYEKKRPRPRRSQSIAIAQGAEPTDRVDGQVGLGTN